MLCRGEWSASPTADLSPEIGDLMGPRAGVDVVANRNISAPAGIRAIIVEHVMIEFWDSTFSRPKSLRYTLIPPPFI